MNRHFRKLLFVCFWLSVVAGVMVLLVAAMKAQSHKNCKGYIIRISGEGRQWFLDKKDVVTLLTTQGAIKGRPIKSFDLRSMENRLKSNVWVRNAELFFDNSQVLQVRIEERMPVARLFTTNGSSFYIDSSGERLPLSDKFSPRLPVFTSFPGEKEKADSTDSVLVSDIIHISNYMRLDGFWMAQIAQIDVLPNRTFEMIPVVGNHTIVFGDGNDYDKKFRRLLLFYQQILSKTGMDIYKQINVQYAREVIGVKKG